VGELSALGALAPLGLIGLDRNPAHRRTPRRIGATA
jgi:hypothetical protein